MHISSLIHLVFTYGRHYYSYQCGLRFLGLHACCEEDLSSCSLSLSGSQERSVRDFFIHSTLYALEVERMKNIDFNEVSRLILVDTRQISRIGKFEEIVGKPGVEIHIYDHHPPSPDDVHGSVEVIAEVGANVTHPAQDSSREGD